MYHLLILNFPLTARKYCMLGDLSAQIGWNKQELVKSLEEKRQTRASEYYQRKQTLKVNIEKEVQNLSEVQKIKNELKQYGY